MKLKFLYGLMALTVAFTACEDDENTQDPIQNVEPIAIDDSKEWADGNINAGDTIVYKVSCATDATTATVEWAERSAQGENHTYTGDIMVSAYQLDGTTPYFEEKDNGYSDKSKSFTLVNNESEFILRVSIGESNTEGSYGLRVSSASATGTIEYKDLAIGDTWTAKNIDAGEVKGFKVAYTSESKLAVVWAEAGTPEDSPEGTYTADIVGSVYRADDATVYTYDKEGTIKDFLDKNKSHTDDMKVIETKSKDAYILVRIKGITAGNFAIKVIEITD